MRILFLLTYLILCSWLVAQTDQPSSFGKGISLYDHNRTFAEEGTIFFNPEWAPFFHGVASGDPLADRVIIWTRVTPDTLETAAVDVNWRVATDVNLMNVVATGTFTTDASRDYTVKVDVTGLSSGTTYYYGFIANGVASLTGKTKTTPTGDAVDHLKFGVVSCSNYQAGYFNAYGRLAARTDLDAIIHLGDYIYEYANFVYGSDSIWQDRTVMPPTEIVELNDYYSRYSTYRLDTNLIRLHQQHPMIAVWDDHESANDSYLDGAENHDPATQGDWEARKSAAKKAYFEWMPIRENDDASVYRAIEYGDLMELILLDTRLEGREEQINDVTDPALYAEDRTILGETQKSWFFDQLSTSTAKWKVIGQQVIFAEFNVGWAALSDPNTSFSATESIFLDIWDGYPAERQQIISYLDDNNIDNVVLLTGDFHSTFAFDVPSAPVNLVFDTVPGVGVLPFYLPSPAYDAATGAGSVAVEFAVPSVCSANFDENVGPALAAGFQFQINNNITPFPGLNLGNPNPHMKYNDLTQHGYYILDVKADSVQANWYFTPILAPSEEEAFGNAYYTKDTENHLQNAPGASTPKAEQDTPAPSNPPVLTTSTNEVALNNVSVFSIFPNPTTQRSTINYAMNGTSGINISLYNSEGQLVRTFLNQRMAGGIYSLETDLSGLAAGIYIYKITTEKGVNAQRIVIQ